ncbi:MAG TPA: ABC transporter substrate-binding protein [Burkholderiales bacterium]|jgi:branched-chain amino acid transport system substrate-binding protein|nr:ABC transporter substrate-binding protein [Burkholderiales bacterium]
MKASFTHFLAAASLAALATAAAAQTVKVGVVLPYSGVGAEFGQQVDRGMQVYLKLNPNAFGPYKVEFIKRDSKSPSGADAKTAVQELITQEKVDLLAGFVYSPDAIASAPLVTEAKKPMVVMNAGTAWITNLSPMISRVSFSMWHSGYAMGEAAVKNLKAKTAVIGYTDFPPGKDSLQAFKHAFEKAGGKVIDEIPMGGPGQVPDFTPFFQRAKDKKPDVFYVFVPSGDHAVAVMKTYAALGMRQAGIKLIGPGDLTPDYKLQGMGDEAVGLITIHHYNADLDNPLNKRFVAAWKKEYGADSSPDFMGVQGYDGMAAIAHVVVTQKGKVDADGAMAALKGWKFNSPQGPIMIDPNTRDIVMNEYLSEVVKSGGRLVQKNIATINAVKDMCKELKEGKCK